MAVPQFTPLPNLSLDTFQNQVKVIVGAEKAEVFISIDLLTQHSGYFKGACDEQWNSGRTKTVILDHEESEIFGVFLDWLDRSAPPSIKVIVGKGDAKKQLSIRKDLICSQSEFFKTASKSEWKCGKTNTVTLEDDDPMIVGMFLTWVKVSAKGVPNLLKIVDNPFDNTVTPRYLSQQLYENLVQCFILADRLQAPAFQNAIMDSVVILAEDYSIEFNHLLGSTPDLIGEVYNHTLKNSPLRRYLLDGIIGKTNPDKFIETVADDLLYPNQEFIKELLHASLSTIRAMKANHGVVQSPWEKDRCHYHLHPDKPAGYKCTRGEL